MSKNSKEETSKEINRAVNEDAGRKIKGKSKKNGDSRSKTGSSAGSSEVRRTSIAKMKQLKKIQDPAFDFDLDVDEDWMNFLKRCAYFPEELGYEQAMWCILFLNICNYFKLMITNPFLFASISFYHLHLFWLSH